MGEYSYVVSKILFVRLKEEPVSSLPPPKKKGSLVL